MPAGDVAVLDQKYPVLAIEHHGADAERHAADEAPVQVENPAQQRLKPLSQGGQAHCRCILRLAKSGFDPCASATRLPIEGWENLMAAFTLVHLSAPHFAP